MQYSITSVTGYSHKKAGRVGSDSGTCSSMVTHANAMIWLCVDGMPRSPHRPSCSHVAAGRSILTSRFSSLLSTACVTALMSASRS